MTNQYDDGDVVLSKKILYFPIKSEVEEPDSELQERGEFAVANTLHINNYGEKLMAFKVMVKHLDDYSVKPNMGFIPGGKRIKLEVQRSWKTLTKYPNTSQKEFKVLVAEIDESEALPEIQSFWMDITKKNKETKSFIVETMCKKDVQLPSVLRTTEYMSPSGTYTVGNTFARLDRSCVRFRLTSSDIPGYDEIRPNKKLVSKLHIVNSHHGRIAFKVMTTNPNRYFVKPNYGLVEKGSSQQISIVLLTEELPEDMKSCKDKFQVLVRPASDTGKKYREAVRFTSRIIAPSSFSRDDHSSDSGHDGTSSENLTYVEVENDSSSSSISDETERKEEVDNNSNGIKDEKSDNLSEISTIGESQSTSEIHSDQDVSKAQPKVQYEGLKKLENRRFQNGDKSKVRRTSF